MKSYLKTIYPSTCDDCHIVESPRSRPLIRQATMLDTNLTECFSYYDVADINQANVDQYHGIDKLFLVKL